VGPYPRLSDAGLDVSGLTRDEVTELSTSCQYCNGRGHAIIYDPEYNGAKSIPSLTPDGRTVTRLAETVAYCVCPAGRWVMLRQQKTCPDMFRRTLDLHDVIQGTARRKWLTKDPRPELPDDPADFNKPLGDVWRSLMSRFLKRTDANAATSAPKSGFARARAEAAKQARARESWLVRFLVNALEAGPLPFGSLMVRAMDAGRSSEKELRIAGDLARINITNEDGQEIWALE
jgi:hypothetical protein